MGHIARRSWECQRGAHANSKNIKTLARHLSLAVIGILILILILGSARGMPFADLFPYYRRCNGGIRDARRMPAAVTVVLALGMKIAHTGALCEICLPPRLLAQRR